LAHLGADWYPNEMGTRVGAGWRRLAHLGAGRVKWRQDIEKRFEIFALGGGSMDFGLMLRGQFEQGEDMEVRFGELMEQARLANKLGFASITKGSHYSAYPLQDFQQLPFLARVAAEAPDLRLNAGIVLLSLHKPLDLAEQLASIDVMSGGRLIFGAGLGYREVEFRAFGSTQKERVKRFEENLEAVKRLWTEEKVSMKASHFELIEASCPMKPIQKPYPPIWIGANSDPGIRRAAQMGDCWYINPHNRLDTTLRQIDVYRRALDEYGKPFPQELPMRREVFVAPTRADAIRICKPFLEIKYKVYHQWGQDKAMPEGDNDLGMEFEELIRDRFLIGSPDEVAEQILTLSQDLGVNHFIMSVQWPGMPQSLVLDTMHILAEEVLPKVRQGMQ
jgi:alkanesulfonate monooxygenase SsuD/methylene tetrahydromethanopterin reductase-like flavin-dependent oxidoreductase (luciferase family)